MVRMFESVLGNVIDERFSGKLHDLDHADRVEYLTIKPDEVARRRLRMKTDKGTECAIALSRNQQLTDGAVLHCDRYLSLVVRRS